MSVGQFAVALAADRALPASALGGLAVAAGYAGRRDRRAALAGTVAPAGRLCLAGTWLYLRASGPRDGVGRWGCVACLLVLSLVYGVTLTFLPPPSIEAIACYGLALWFFPLWAHWFGRHRQAKSPELAA